MAKPSHTLWYMPAVQLARRIRAKEISPVEVTDAFLERIESVNPAIHAFCTIAAEQARIAAKLAEDAVLRGDALGPLHGVPVAVKDLTPTAGIRTTFGSRVFADYIPDRDAVLVARIKKAGAILLGKTNTPEFGHKGTTDNALFGITRNPWNTECTSGGSSGGSAAAVAAGMVPLAEGSDGGGSIRIPASACGVYGLKPTYGRVPYDAKPNNLFASLNPYLHNGPLSRTVEDAALLLSVMAGPDPSDPLCLPDTGESYTERMRESVRGLRVAYSPDLGLYEIDTRVRSIIDNAVEQLQHLGCHTETVSLDFGLSKEQIVKAFGILWFTQMAAAYGSLLPEKEEWLTPDVVKMIRIGESIRAVEYKQVELVRTALWRTIQTVFQDYDVLVTPTLAVPPFSCKIKGPSEINGKPAHPDTDWMLTSLFNMTGHPAASLPAGFTDDRLPVGMQVIGRRFEDSTVLRFSYACETIYEWTRHTPHLDV